MKKIPLKQFLAVSLAAAIIASAASAASPAQNLLLVQMKLSPATNASSVPVPPKPKFGGSVQPGTQACVPSPPLPKRSPGAVTSKC